MPIDKDIHICLKEENDIHVSLQDPCPVKLNFNDRIVIKQVEPDHSKLDNLDYENSGHIGFMPTKISLLPNLPSNSKNKNLRLSLFDNTTETSYVTNFNDMRKRIITTENSSYVHTEEGQYVFIEIDK